jgi:hypothetical protein
MVGARLFDQHEGHGITMLLGCITTGEAWQFLKLEWDVIIIEAVFLMTQGHWGV